MLSLVGGYVRMAGALSKRKGDWHGVALVAWDSVARSIVEAKSRARSSIGYNHQKRHW